jgi:hypothetical protein
VKTLHETHTCRDCGAEITLPYAQPDAPAERTVLAGYPLMNLTEQMDEPERAYRQGWNRAVTTAREEASAQPDAPAEQCEHLDGDGTHQGYTYRCLLVKHDESVRHFHDRRPEARAWYEQSTGYPPPLFAAQPGARR